MWLMLAWKWLAIKVWLNEKMRKLKLSSKRYLGVDVYGSVLFG